MVVYEKVFCLFCVGFEEVVECDLCFVGVFEGEGGKDVVNG